MVGGKRRGCNPMSGCGFRGCNPGLRSDGFKTSDGVVAVEREVGRQGFVVGLLPSVVAFDSAAVFAACIKMVESCAAVRWASCHWARHLSLEGVFKVGNAKLAACLSQNRFGWAKPMR